MTVLLMLCMIVTFLAADKIVRTVRVAKARRQAGVPSGAMFHPPEGISLALNHTWMKMEKGVAVIGMDEFLARMLGAVESVLLPGVGAAVAPANAEISLSSGGRKIRLASPVEGRVMEVNTDVLSNPAAAHRDPYGGGWLFKVSPSVRVPVSGSLSGAAAGEWLRTQMDLAKEFLTSASGGRRGAMITTLPDGGTPADGALKHCDAAAWEEFERRFTTIKKHERATR